MAKAKVMALNGEYWFSKAYAAELLGTTRGKIETMIVRGFLTPSPMLGSDWIAETDVNHLRHNPDQYAYVKKQLHEPASPKRGERMPEGTVYKGDPIPRSARFKGRIGNPLKDSPQS
jgi:hypothetical protein